MAELLLGQPLFQGRAPSTNGGAGPGHAVQGRARMNRNYTEFKFLSEAVPGQGLPLKTPDEAIDLLSKMLIHLRRGCSLSGCHRSSTNCEVRGRPCRRGYTARGPPRYAAVRADPSFAKAHVATPPLLFNSRRRRRVAGPALMCVIPSRPAIPLSQPLRSACARAQLRQGSSNAVVGGGAGAPPVGGDGGGDVRSCWASPTP